jgi:hypothetical protein
MLLGQVAVSYRAFVLKVAGADIFRTEVGFLHENGVTGRAFLASY